MLGVHDPAFPTRAEDDVGRGTPYGAGARELLEWARSIGFDGVQLGPQGATSESNPSPYDGTIFSKNPLSIDLRALVDEGLLARESLDRIVEERPSGGERRVPYGYVFSALDRALDEAHATFVERGQDVTEYREFLRKNADWLERDALYHVLCRVHEQPHWSLWRADRTLFAPRNDDERAAFATRRTDLVRTHAAKIDRYAFAQWIAHRQHARARADLSRIGLRLFGDLQIGVSEIDAWGLQSLFLDELRMGAPPSRTHPLGQAWGYRVFHPDRYEGAVALVRARLSKMLDGLDGVRIDHPHGLVDPWVYRPARGVDDPLAAVRAGARLFSSPHRDDLARWSIARADELDRSQSPWAEAWVRDLDDEQVDRYGVLFDAIVDELHAHARGVESIACEVLSTQPYPLRRVIDRHRLGRFRVTQKVDLHDARDVYRSENARPEDWILVGNHDTRSIWSVVDAWKDAGTLADHAAYVAARLEPGDARAREHLTATLTSDRHALARAKLAELFTSPARNVMIFFTDLFGERETYNEPGTIGDANWSLRTPSDWRARHEALRAQGSALDLRHALAMGLRAKGLRPDLAASLSQSAP